METVLVVEDEQDERNALTHLLRGRGYAVESAANGEEALDVLRRLEPPPALVLLDLNMPVMDGRALLSYLATDERLRAIDVIVTSAATMPGDAVARPTTAFLAKPIRPSSLLDLVAATMQHRHGRAGDDSRADGVVQAVREVDTQKLARGEPARESAPARARRRTRS
jgi:CheY-like chemotaxis protein